LKEIRQIRTLRRAKKGRRLLLGAALDALVDVE